MVTIKQLREMKGYSQEELARLAMVSYMTVSRMERGKPISMTSVKRVCSALEVTPDSVEALNITNPYKK